MINISDIHRKWATIAFEAAQIADPTIVDADIDAYLERIHQPQYDALVAASCESWKPIDHPDVVVLKEEISEKLKDATKEKLEAIVAELDKPTKG